MNEGLLYSKMSNRYINSTKTTIRYY